MKKIFYISFLIFLTFFAWARLLYASNTYNINELNISLNIPDGYSVFLKNMSSDNYLYKKIGVSKDKVDEFMVQNRSLLYAIADGNPVEIYVNSPMNNAFKSIVDLNDYSDDEIKEITNEVRKKDLVLSKGLISNNSYVYRYNNVAYLVHDYSGNLSNNIGNKDHFFARCYMTIKGHDFILITLLKGFEPLNNVDYKILQNVADSMVFLDPPKSIQRKDNIISSLESKEYSTANKDISKYSTVLPFNIDFTQNKILYASIIIVILFFFYIYNKSKLIRFRETNIENASQKRYGRVWITGFALVILCFLSYFLLLEFGFLRETYDLKSSNLRITVPKYYRHLDVTKKEVLVLNSNDKAILIYNGSYAGNLFVKDKNDLLHVDNENALSRLRLEHPQNNITSFNKFLSNGKVYLVYDYEVVTDQKKKCFNRTYETRINNDSTPLSIVFKKDNAPFSNEDSQRIIDIIRNIEFY